MPASSSSAAPQWTGRATSGGTSCPRARSASKRPRPTGRPAASTSSRATRLNSSRCRSDAAGAAVCGGRASAALAQRLQVRQLLFDAPNVLPRVLLEAAEALHEIEDRVLVAAGGTAKFLPRDRNRHRRAGARARRIGGNRSLLERIAQIIDEDLSPAQRLRHLGEIALGIVGGHRLREGLNEGLGGVPIGAHDGDDDVQSLAAGELDEAFEIDRGKPLANLARRIDEPGPRDPLAGIEVEDDAVAA